MLHLVDGRNWPGELVRKATARTRPRAGFCDDDVLTLSAIGAVLVDRLLPAVSEPKTWAEVSPPDRRCMTVARLHRLWPPQRWKYELTMQNRSPEIQRSNPR